VRERDIVEDNVELSCALEEVLPDARRHNLSLRDELGGVKLGHNGFQDFVADRWEDTLSCE
jgi:hypothetical protein